VHPLQQGIINKGSCSGASIITRVANLNAKRSTTQNYLSGLANLCSSTACNQGRL